MNIALFLQNSFIAITIAIILSSVFEPLRQRFLVYGSRSNLKPSTPNPAAQKQRPHSYSPLQRALDSAAAAKFPHTWFYHFYATALTASLFWGLQYATNGSLLRRIAFAQTAQSRPSMSTHQVLLAWTMLTIQASRRLYECLTLSKPSSATMWVGHWALGLGFYVAMSISVWIEGSESIIHAPPPNLTIPQPSLKTWLSTPVFILASGLQYDCHVYLASLRKYSLPTHPAFHRITCPHYFAECLIYLSLSVAAAPMGTVVNRTVGAALVFVIVNLGITAAGTRRFYVERFGGEVGRKWCMIPWVW